MLTWGAFTASIFYSRIFLKTIHKFLHLAHLISLLLNVLHLWRTCVYNTRCKWSVICKNVVWKIINHKTFALRSVNSETACTHCTCIGLQRLRWLWRWRLDALRLSIKSSLMLQLCADERHRYWFPIPDFISDLPFGRTHWRDVL